mgnify:CR=1 FL=1
MANALVSIGGFHFPEPSSYSGSTSTMVDAGRNVEGVMIGSVIRANVAKVELGWNFLTVQQWADIIAKFDEGQGGKFIQPVTFFDQSRATWVTRQMYVSDRSAGLWRRDPKNGAILGWTGCKLSLIEV